MDKTYIAIDLKSFYASVECAERHLNPLTTNLVVADPTRTEKTICLAVSPSLKAYGISGRARLFEVVERVKQINSERLNRAARLGAVRPDKDSGRPRFASSSFDDEALRADPSLELSYIIAPPRMRMYEEYSTKIFSIYMKYVSADDIHVYSVDEVFMDVTRYLATYHLTPHELAMTMIREVLYTTGITATAGIGTNLYLAKVAMDIVAKHVPPDRDGVRIASLDEYSYREALWAHRPLTDFWRVGRGYAKKLEGAGLFTMGDIARASLNPHQEDQLYRLFGINAELLIDHAWGWEPTEIRDIKAYRPAASSISSGQVLMEPYDFEKCRVIVQEMTELLVLDLVSKHLVTKQVVLTIGYDRESLTGERGKNYTGSVVKDYYGRPVPKHAHGSANLDRYTSSTKAIMQAMLSIYDRTVDPQLLMRRVNVVACGVIPETDIPPEAPMQLNLFDAPEESEHAEQTRRAQDAQERRLQEAVLHIQGRYGKNAILKGTSFREGATTIQRNQQIGGHKAE